MTRDPRSAVMRFVGPSGPVPQPARRAVGRFLRATGLRRSTTGPRPDEAAVATPQGPRAYAVESFDQEEVRGSVTADASAFPVHITLHVNDVEVADTWAVSQGLLGAPDQETASFRIALVDVWNYCTHTDRLTVQADGEPVPLPDNQAFRHPDSDGELTIEDLKAKFAEGYLFGQYGELQLAKTLDSQWQDEVFDLYRRVNEVVQREHGYETFAIYGSLLGAVREGDFISHDLDFDAGYLSRLTAGREVAAELRDICMTLIEAGFEVTLLRTVLHARDTEGSLRIDLFPMFFNRRDVLAIPFGVAGRTEVPKSSWTGLVDGHLGRHVVRIPANAEQIVERLYGPSWRTPIAGFTWKDARVSRAREAIVPPRYREEVYWANFYSHHLMDGGSTFFDALNARTDLPSIVVDIGCGDGRDSRAFAESGRRVVGMDRSAIALRHATQRAVELGISDRLTFIEVDVADVDALNDALRTARATTGDQPVLVYLRFFLHSIPERVQDDLMAAISAWARDGDMLAAEFRAAQDEDEPKTYGNHYRRFQDGATFGRHLREEYGFSIELEQEGTGLAPYGEEDPYLYRVLARRHSEFSSG